MGGGGRAKPGFRSPWGRLPSGAAWAAKLAGAVEGKIRESLLYAMKHPDEAWPYIRRHAQEMAPEVIRLHIDAFVNEFSIDAGPEGERALRSLLEAACALENRPSPRQSLFWS